MNRINLFRDLSVRTKAVRSNPVTLESLAWGKIHFDKTAGTLMFAALLIVCSIAVGCPSDKPQPASTTNQSGMTQPTATAINTPTSAPPAPEMQAATKPLHKKVVRKAPVTVTYADKGSGVSFQYPRKYSLETGDAAEKLLSSDPAPMAFVQTGGGGVGGGGGLGYSFFYNGVWGGLFYVLFLNNAPAVRSVEHALAHWPP